jgi:hypothetical protein
MHGQPVNAGGPPGHPGEPEGMHAGPGAHPTPTAFERDPAHGNPQAARSEHPYPSGYEQHGSPQGQGDHKAPPQPQNATQQQPQNANHPAPQSHNDHGNGNGAGNAGGKPAPQAQSQHPAAPAHAQQADNKSHKNDDKNEHDPKHGQGNDH